MNPWRVFLLVLAVGMLPFGLDSWNAARIIGAAAAATFIILTVWQVEADCEVDAPERWSRAEAIEDEREHRAWHEQRPGLVFVDGHAPKPADPSPVRCTHEGGEWPSLDRCADCGQMLDPADQVRCPKCGGPHPFHDPACVVHPDLIQDHNEQERVMPSAIIKPKPDEDFYVRYSTIVDSPCESGTREALIAYGVDPDRLDRADAAGTSAQWGYTDDTLWLGWQDTEIHVREGVMDPTEPDGAWWGTIARADLRAFCETLSDDGNFHPPAGMVTWSIPEEGDPS